MPVVDDCGVVIVRDVRGIERGRRTLDGANERLFASLRHERVVRRDARLSRIEELACHEARRSQAEIGVGRDHRRRLAAELQRHGREVLGRCARDCAPDRGRSSEEQVIERQARERLSDRRVAEDDRELLLGERFHGELAQQRRCRRRELRRLQQDAIAGGNGAGDRRERQLHGIVPRADDADHADGLPLDARASGLEVDRRGDALRPHPAGEVPARVGDFRRDDVELRKARLVRGTAAEILIDGFDESRLVPRHEVQEACEPVASHVERWIALLRERCALHIEEPCKLAHRAGPVRSSRSNRANSGDSRTSVAPAVRRRSTASGDSANDVGRSLRYSISLRSCNAANETSIA